jgi:hypothetical protein
MNLKSADSGSSGSQPAARTRQTEMIFASCELSVEPMRARPSACGLTVPKVRRVSFPMSLSRLS